MKKTSLSVIMILFMIALPFSLKSQVTVGASVAPEKFSILQIEGSDGGVRLPQLTLADKSKLTGLVGNEKAKGLLIYNISDNRLEYWDGTAWRIFGSVTGTNGVTVASDIAKLGGSLVENTSIDLNEFNLEFSPTAGTGGGTFYVTSPTNANLLTVKNGKVGINMEPVTTDASVLQITGPITINDGTPLDSRITYVLATDDGTGQARWTPNPSMISTFAGALSTNGYSGNTTARNQATGSSITLPPGTWMIQSSLFLATNSGVVGTPVSGYCYIRLYYANTNSSPTGPSADIVENTAKYVGGAIHMNTSWATMYGFTILRNSSNASKTYHLIFSDAATDKSYPLVGLGGSRWSETAIVAYPITSVRQSQ